MKKLSRFITLCLVSILMLSLMTVQSSASTVSPNDQLTHKYDVYPIFTGSQAAGNNKNLGDIAFDTNFSYSSFWTALNNLASTSPFYSLKTTLTSQYTNGSTVNGIASTSDASAVAKRMSVLNDSDARLLGQFLYDNRATIWSGYSPTRVTPENGLLTVANAGYYLVVDSENITSDSNFMRNLSLLLLSKTTTVSGNNVIQMTLADKVDTPTVEKKLMDINDSMTASQTVGVTGSWQDGADYDIGDWVPMKLTATVPAGISNYQTYSIQFYDSVSSGSLRINNQIKWIPDDSGSEANFAVDDANGVYARLYLDNALVNNSARTTAGATIVRDGTNTSHFAVCIADVKSLITDFTIPHTISFVYRAQLTDDESVIFGNPGNPNTVKLYYTSNPDSTTPASFPDGADSSTDAQKATFGYTPPDEVRVFTYKLRVTKQDQNNVDLPGAGFTLYKWKAATSSYEAVGTEISADTGSSSVFTWSGLDDGFYRIVETTVPYGYNKVDDMIFDFSATHTDTDNINNATLSSINAYRLNENGSSASGAETSTIAISSVTSAQKSDPLTAHSALSVLNETISGTARDTGLKTTIINQIGIVLPETGGMGTQIFYVCGGLMLTLGAVLLITKKRMGETD